VTIDEMMEAERRMMGRDCVFMGHTALDVGPHRVDTIVYEVPPNPGSRFAATQHRWAVFVDGKCSMSGIAGTERA
jgi:hypothetical protein